MSLRFSHVVFSRLLFISIYWHWPFVYVSCTNFTLIGTSDRDVYDDGESMLIVVVGRIPFSF